MPRLCGFLSTRNDMVEGLVSIREDFPAGAAGYAKNEPLSNHNNIIII